MKALGLVLVVISGALGVALASAPLGSLALFVAALAVTVVLTVLVVYGVTKASEVPWRYPDVAWYKQLEERPRDLERWRAGLRHSLLARRLIAAAWPLAAVLGIAGAVISVALGYRAAAFSAIAVAVAGLIDVVSHILARRRKRRRD
jgi:hypothetical protein